MEKMRNIKDFQGLVSLWKENAETLKKAALPVVVVISLIAFWVFGGEDNLEVTEGTETMDGITVNEALQEGEGEASETVEIYVDIGGEVETPGVYKVPLGTRLFQVIEKAGGLKETADTDSINQAETVTDGQKIIIGSRVETSPYYTGTTESSDSVISGITESGSGADSGAVRETADGTVVNINLATLEELQLIPGVGPSTAQKIIDYREANGNFQEISEIKNISGIGDKTYENLKDYIEV